MNQIEIQLYKNRIKEIFALVKKKKYYNKRIRRQIK